MIRSLQRGGVMQLVNNRYGLALSWDRLKTNVDLDLQALVVDEAGTIIDAVYYNRLEGLDRALTHSGDELIGAAEGFDEAIWVNLTKVRKEVKLIIFVVAAHSGGSLRDAGDATIHIVEKWHGNTVETFKIGGGSGGGVVASAVMNRSPDGTWTLTRTSDSGDDGNHFMDILEPTLGDIIRKRIKGAPKRQRVQFPMSKGSTADLPKASKMQRVAVGVGWDMGSLGIDLDVSAVLFGELGQKVGAVYYNNTKAFGVCHTGDNETGEGEGDDEVITVDLNQVPEAVAQIFFVVNVYSKDVTFHSLKNAYCRVSDDVGCEMLRYALTSGSMQGSGLLISRLYRNVKTKRWGFQAIGSFCQGRKWMDRTCLKEMQRVFQISPKQLESQGGGSTPRGNASSSRSPRVSLSKSREEKVLPPKMPGLTSQTSLFIFEQEASCGCIRVGVGWDILNGKRGTKTSVDLDVAAVFFHSEGRDIGAIDYENVDEYGVRHSGDNKTGEGEGDDEVIDVNLEAIPLEVAQIFFVVTVFTKGMTFQMVENAYCRVCAQDGAEIVRHDLTSGLGTSSATGLVIAQLIRQPDKGWAFKARSAFCAARTWIDPTCMGEMKSIFKETQREMNPDPDAPQPQVTPVAMLWRGRSCGEVLGTTSDMSEASPHSRRIISL